MKLFSLVAVLSCASITSVFSFSVNAETLLNGQHKTDAEITANELANSSSYEYVEQQSHLSLNNLHGKNQNVNYSVFSFAKDKQITLHNIGQDLAVENVEWYIQKF